MVAQVAGLKYPSGMCMAKPFTVFFYVLSTKQKTGHEDLGTTMRCAHILDTCERGFWM
jgi:hypothetical protein